MDERSMKKKFNIALIATYPKMSKAFMKVAANSGVGIYNIYASFEEAARIAKEVEHKIDAILSRGGTAQYIKRAVDIPVIFVPITPFDIAQIIHNLDPSVKEVCFFHFKRNILGIREIEEMYGIKIHEYTFLDKNDITAGVEDAYKKGISTLIGGEVAADYARQKGMNGIEVSAGEEAVSRAFDETCLILTEKEKEKSRGAQLKAAFNATTEGVIVTDENKRIVLCNSTAEKIFRLKNPVGQEIAENVGDDMYLNTWMNQKSEINYIRQIEKTVYNVNHHPVFLENRFVGVVSAFEDITKIQNLEKKIRNEMHTKGFVAKSTFSDISTQDQSIIGLIEMANLYAKTNSAILIEGESGTGKEIFAQGLHNASNRADGPFVAVNCAAIPENLLESELFGYEAGAFTGARKEGCQGLFELAHNGTIFLDEIGEISKTIQTRLLRVLQEKEVMRVGGRRIIPVNSRIISATNKNLRKMLETNDFREDLYYRLNVFHLRIPPLRERKNDIRLLGEIFLKRLGIVINDEMKNRIFEIMDVYSWPGNIRELQNVIERTGILSILKQDLTKNELSVILGLHRVDMGQKMELSIRLGGNLKETMATVEKEIVEHFLDEYDNNQELVAERLGIGKTTLWRKAK